MIIPLYQPQGSSSHLLAKAYGDSIGEKATHTGTLDPMAEGVLIILTGEDRFKKGELSDWHKHYQFEILWGVSTDSLDLLGLTLPSFESEIIEFNQIKDQVTDYLHMTINDFIGEYRQQMPNFSAKRIGGKSAFDLAKSGLEIKDTFTDVELFSAKVLGHREIDSEELLRMIEHKVDRVQGDFRQTQVMNNWHVYLNNLTNNYLISSVEIETSKRFYVRAFVRDLSQRLNIPATTFSIVRTQNGEYSIGDCKTK